MSSSWSGSVGSARIRHKSPKDVVTEVDHLSEALILAAHPGDAFPDDGVLAEESGVQPPAGATGCGSSTRSTARSTTRTASRSSACRSPSSWTAARRSGVVHDPSAARRTRRPPDGPATLDGVAIAADPKPLLSDFVISLTLDGPRLRERLAAVREAIRVTRRIGSSALALAYVANGRFDAFAQTHGLSAWDVAAAGLIAERAGATVTDASRAGRGSTSARGTATFGVVAAPPAHHASAARARPAAG